MPPTAPTCHWYLQLHWSPALSHEGNETTGYRHVQFASRSVLSLSARLCAKTATTPVRGRNASMCAALDGREVVSRSTYFLPLGREIDVRPDEVASVFSLPGGMAEPVVLWLEWWVGLLVGDDVW